MNSKTKKKVSYEQGYKKIRKCKYILLLILSLTSFNQIFKFCKAQKLGINVNNLKNNERRNEYVQRNRRDSNSNSGEAPVEDSFNREVLGFVNYDSPIGPEEYSETRRVSTEEKLKVYRERVYEMFHSSYDNYIQYAYPEDELKPISCSGQNTWGNFSLTLIDALDTFAVMDDVVGFEKALEKVEKINFNMDINISVFETTIRVLGGLLSSHLIAKDYAKQKKIKYNNELLVKAEDLGNRLLPAFDTPTGMPFGSVNLKRGVEPSETSITCTATIGTCSIEFAWLSILTDNPVYEYTCRRAIHSLWSHRTNIGLIGAHIDVFTGRWTEAAFSISGGVDSFYEYLLKSWIGFSDEKEYGEMFLEMYELIHKYIRRDDGWHVYASPYNGQITMEMFQSLGAYWPGVKVLAGELKESNEELLLLANYLKNKSFLPEHMQLDMLNRRSFSFINYPLRPELVESLSVMYKATKDPKLLEVAFKQVDRLRKWCKTKCGYANIKNVYDVEIEDKMESFFLSETLKYLYLLFDPDNKYNKGNYIFSTEAHPFPVVSSVKSEALAFYKKKTKSIRRELRKVNNKYDSTRYFINKNKNVKCEIEHWPCSSFPRFYHLQTKKVDNDVNFKLYLSPDFKNIPNERDRFNDFRKGICSYKHWIRSSMMGLETDELLYYLI